MIHHGRGATDICVLFAVSRCGPFCLSRSVRACPTHRTYGDMMKMPLRAPNEKTSCGHHRGRGLDPSLLVPGDRGRLIES